MHIEGGEKNVLSRYYDGLHAYLLPYLLFQFCLKKFMRFGIEIIDYHQCLLASEFNQKP